MELRSKCRYLVLMIETTPQFHRLLCAVAGAARLISDLPDREIPDERTELLLKSHTFLCHAAVEEYLENLSLFVLNTCFHDYLVDGLLREPLAAAAMHYRCTPEDFFSSGVHTRLVKDMFVRSLPIAIARHREIVVANHGIRTDHQKALFEPLGYNIFSRDRALSLALESFGDARGKLAHKFGIRQKLPRAALEADIGGLINLLKRFDTLMNFSIYQFCE